MTAATQGLARLHAWPVRLLLLAAICALVVGVLVVAGGMPAESQLLAPFRWGPPDGPWAA
ncbi:MAG TPA: hypothetical protein VNT28_09750 [Candidatus Limnocylindrales bacterium]|jgi:hypothetical protein|nr:hypothetical protein [Candidatus Limnocylindrales bacterium]